MKEDVSTGVRARENINDPAFLFSREYQSYHSLIYKKITRTATLSNITKLSRAALERRYYENLEQMSFASFVKVEK